MMQTGILIESGNERYVILGWNATPPIISGCKLEITPDDKDFGDVPVGDCSEAAEFNLKNVGIRDAILNIYLTGSDYANFTIIDGGGSYILGSNQSHIIKVKFCPNSENEKNAYLLVDAKGCESVYATLKGTGSRPAGPPTQPPAVEGKWFVVADAHADGLFFAHLPYTKFLDKPHGGQKYSVFFDKFGCVWARSDLDADSLHFYNLRTSTGGSIPVTTYGEGKPVFTLGNVYNNNEMYIFSHAQERRLEILIARYSDGSWQKEASNLYGLDIAPIDIYWDGKEKQCICGSYDYPYNIVAVNEEGSLNGEASASDRIGQCAKDADGNYWFEGLWSNKIYIYSPNLDLIKTIELPEGTSLTGISESTNRDIIAVAYGEGGGEDSIAFIFYADENYEQAHQISLKNDITFPWRCSPWDGDWVLIVGNPSAADKLIGINLKTFETRLVQNIDTMATGDVGLKRYLTWGWNWQPDTDAIKIFLGES